MEKFEQILIGIPFLSQAMNYIYVDEGQNKNITTSFLVLQMLDKNISRLQTPPPISREN